MGYGVRYFDLDPGAVRERLLAMGAHCTRPRRLIQRVALAGAGNAWAALRSEGERHSLTLMNGEPREVLVSDFGAARQILEGLGLIASSQQESHQETWEVHGIEFLLAEWPGLPPSLEINGQQEEHTHWAVRQLGLDPSQAQAAGDPFAGPPGAPRQQPEPEPMMFAAPVMEQVRAEPFAVVELGWTVEASEWEPGEFWIHWAVVLQNPNDGHWCEFPTIQITVRDEQGQVVGTDDQVLNTLPPGTRIAWASSLEVTNGRPHRLEITAKPAEWQATAARPGDFPPFGYQGVRFNVRGRNCQVTGEVVNPHAIYVEQVAVVALFRDGQGALVTGDLSFVEGLHPMSPAPFKIETSVPVGFGPITSLDLLTIPWSSGETNPWELALHPRR